MGQRQASSHALPPEDAPTIDVGAIVTIGLSIYGQDIYNKKGFIVDKDLDCLGERFLYKVFVPDKMASYWLYENEIKEVLEKPNLPIGKIQDEEWR